MRAASKRIAFPDLYCITDARLSGMRHEEQVTAMVEGGARLIQIRDKAMTAAEFALATERCIAICRRSGVLLIVNDRVELAASIGADGVHIGQGDMMPIKARRIMGVKPIVGLSTHNLDQFRRALGEPVDYIAFGPVFGTTTKADADPTVGLEAVAEVVRLMEGDPRPLVLIGGIDRERLPAVQDAAPYALIAMIGAIVSGGQIAQRVREMRAMIVERT